MKRVAAALTLVALLGTTLGAHQLVPEPAAWQAVADALQPGAFISIRLKDGRTVRGTILQKGPDALLFKPKTRVPVPAAEIPFRDIDSLEAKKPGWSPGMKVVVGVATAVGVTMLLGAIAMAAAGY